MVTHNRWMQWTLGALLLFGFSGCEIELDRLAGTDAKSQGSTTSSASRSLPPAASGDTITIASFNIQVFGQSKLKDEDAMQVLAQIARRFDVMAIQEVRSRQQNVLPEFVKRINANGAHYNFILGPRQGRTSSKEQYAVVYNTERIELIDQGYVVPDPSDLLHREPMASTFRVRGLPANEAFSFTLLNIHTDPDETDTELDALADQFKYVQGRDRQDDVILLGDLNVDQRRMGELGRLPNIAWTVAGQKTNTRGTKSYDNIVFDKSRTTEYLGQAGVLDLKAEYGLTLKQALKVSDHLPVWAVFSAREAGATRVASPSPTTRR